MPNRDREPLFPRVAARIENRRASAYPCVQQQAYAPPPQCKLAELKCPAMPIAPPSTLPGGVSVVANGDTPGAFTITLTGDNAGKPVSIRYSTPVSSQAPSGLREVELNPIERYSIDADYDREFIRCTQTAQTANGRDITVTLKNYTPGQKVEVRIDNQVYIVDVDSIARGPSQPKPGGSDAKLPEKSPQPKNEVNPRGPVDPNSPAVNPKVDPLPVAPLPRPKDPTQPAVEPKGPAVNPVVQPEPLPVAPLPRVKGPAQPVVDPKGPAVTPVVQPEPLPVAPLPRLKDPAPPAVDPKGPAVNPTVNPDALPVAPPPRLTEPRPPQPAAAPVVKLDKADEAYANGVRDSAGETPLVQYHNADHRIFIQRGKDGSVVMCTQAKPKGEKWDSENVRTDIQIFKLVINPNQTVEWEVSGFTVEKGKLVPMPAETLRKLCAPSESGGDGIVGVRLRWASNKNVAPIIGLNAEETNDYAKLLIPGK